jgi:hypothetical protein
MSRGYFQLLLKEIDRKIRNVRRSIVRSSVFLEKPVLSAG